MSQRIPDVAHGPELERCERPGLVTWANVPVQYRSAHHQKNGKTDSGHQEVYVVVSGLAEFTIGGERVQAAPGVVVSAPDPAAVRSYRALEPETRIVCIGAAPGPDHPYGDWITEAAAGRP